MPNKLQKPRPSPSVAPRPWAVGKTLTKGVSALQAAAKAALRQVFRPAGPARAVHSAGGQVEPTPQQGPQAFATRAKRAKKRARHAAKTHPQSKPLGDMPEATQRSCPAPAPTLSGPIVDVEAPPSASVHKHGIRLARAISGPDLRTLQTLPSAGLDSNHDLEFYWIGGVGWLRPVGRSANNTAASTSDIARTSASSDEEGDDDFRDVFPAYNAHCPKQVHHDEPRAGLNAEPVAVPVAFPAEAYGLPPPNALAEPEAAARALGANECLYDESGRLGGYTVVSFVSLYREALVVLSRLDAQLEVPGAHYPVAYLPDFASYHAAANVYGEDALLVDSTGELVGIAWACASHLYREVMGLVDQVGRQVAHEQTEAGALPAITATDYDHEQEDHVDEHADMVGDWMYADAFQHSPVACGPLA